jgi:predicted nucleotidyltransferase
MPEQTLPAILQTVRRELALTLGDRLDTIILFGSRARGEARPDSDIDLLVVVHGEFDYSDLLQRTSPGLAALSLQNDVVISRVFVSREQYNHASTPFLLNVRREGVVV